MSAVSTKQVIGILFFMLIGLGLFFHQGFAFDAKAFHLYAISLAAFLPSVCFQLAKIKFALTWPIILAVSVFIGSLWYFIVKEFYPASAIGLGGIVACGSYLILRLK